MSIKPPVSTTTLQSLAREACTATLSLASAYDHTKAPEWNSAIVNKLLQALSSAPVGDAAAAVKPQYKYAVNSTIIQHLDATTPVPTSTMTSTGTGTGSATTGMETPGATPEPSSGNEDASGESGAGETSVAPESGRRGMHSATGAFWNNETDGMWSYKWEGGEEHGMDVVLMVIWVLA